MAIKNNLHNLFLMIGLILFFFLNLAEMLLVFFKSGSISTIYILIQVGIFVLISCNWFIMDYIIKNEVLSSKYRGTYFVLNCFTIFCIYLILLFPNFTQSNDFTLNYLINTILAGLVSSFSILFGLSLFSLREIDVRTRTGKSLWSVRRSDSLLMSYEKRIAIILFIVVPVLLIIGYIFFSILYDALTAFNFEPYQLKVFLSSIPFIMSIVFLTFYAFSLNSKYKERLDEVTRHLEQAKFH